MANALYDSTRIDISAGGCMFRATGSIQKFDGFLALYEETTEEIVDENGEDENVRLPEVEVERDGSASETVRQTAFHPAAAAVFRGGARA